MSQVAGSTPMPNPTQPPIPATPKSQPSSSNTGAFTIIGAVLGFIAYVIFGAGAARLSYNKFGSVFWAIVAFFFAHFYYPFYAFNYSTSSFLGAARRLRK